MKILIVEDEPTSREILSALLDPVGDCIAAEDGLQAVNAFKEAMSAHDPFNLIIMDIMMPNASGHEAVRNIRQIEQDNNIKTQDMVKIIMVTALGDQKNVAHAFFKGGAVSYIVKPVDKKKLYSELEKLGIIST